MFFQQAFQDVRTAKEMERFDEMLKIDIFHVRNEDVNDATYFCFFPEFGYHPQATKRHVYKIQDFSSKRIRNFHSVNISIF